MRTPLALVVAPLLLAASCAPSSPQARIARQPETFARLDAREKQLVERGELARGMTPEAVRLAWGEPSRRYDGEQDGKPTERWDYVRSEPRTWDGFYFGPSFGDIGPYRYRAFGLGVAPGVSYEPVLHARVIFLNGRVDSWERNR